MSARHYCDKCKKEISGVDIFSIHVDIDSPLFKKKRMCDREYCQDCLMEFYKFIVPNPIVLVWSRETVIKDLINRFHRQIASFLLYE